jgi:FkbM family methyltransferase
MEPQANERIPIPCSEGLPMTKILSRACIAIARRLPRGGWRLAQWAAIRDPALHCIACQIKGVPNPVYLDVRDKGRARLFLHGDGPGNRGVRALLPKLLREGDFFIDIGANYGLVSMVATEAVGANGKVVAAEGLPSVARILSHTFEGYPNVKVLPVAISKTKGTVAFFQTEGSILSGLSEEKIGGHRLEVESCRLLDIIDDEGAPDVLKVDVEGSEVQVFESAAETLQGDQCPVIIFEALSVEELDECKVAISRLHGGNGSYYRVSRAGTLQSVSSTKETSDYVYVPEHLSERVAEIVSK